MTQATTVPDGHPPRRRRDPPARLRRLPGAARGHPGGRRGGARGRLPPHRHRRPPTATRSGVGAAIAASGIPREEVFVTTKLWNSQQGYDSTLAAFEESLGRLGLDHVDLYLIHWPVPTEDRFVDTWRAFERIHEEGGARTIGVSNFRDRGPRAARARRRRRCRRSTRSSSTRASSRPSCAPGTPSTASRPRPGARSPRATCSTTRRSPRSPAATAGRRPRRSCAGTCSSATSSSPSRSRRSGSARTSSIFDFELSAEDDGARSSASTSAERIGPDPATFVAP